MIELQFEKIYNQNREREHIFFGIPFKKGELNTESVSVKNKEGKAYPCCARATARWSDGSIKWLFVRAMADLPANAGTSYFLDIEDNVKGEFSPISVNNNIVKTENLEVSLSTEKNRLFDYIKFNNKKFDHTYISAPILEDDNNIYDFKIDKWYVREECPLCTVISGEGYHSLNNVNVYKFQINLTFYAEKDWFELGCKIINTTDEPLNIKSWTIVHNHPKKSIRNTVAISNYKTNFLTGESVEQIIDANYLKFEANEHNPEVFYGTFFADSSNEESGLCATIFQAQQNFPKALSADEKGFVVKLVPEGVMPIIMQSGMAREQKVLFHFHNNEDLQSLNNRSTIYQMPDRPAINPQVFKNSGVFEDVFAEKMNRQAEIFIIGRADEHSRCYGMLNWGDSVDLGYTAQGRGGGELVWTNNEYDFPHACALMYARTGVRRYMDYVLVTAKHWLDVDICHYSKNPLEMNGQWEHTNGHCKNSVIVCSHQWVEGLLDYYHLTGDIQAYNAALGIGENVKRLLETPVFQKSGQASARETGWALRTLVALYNETNDSSWLEKCDWIVGHFRQWKEDYGLWLAPYTDNVAIRVVFMISVAVGSLMRYYRVNKSPEIKAMILDAVDDLIENARLDNGLFYYKELPSLKRLGNNPLILEALAVAFELTGNKEYLQVGMPTFEYVMSNKPSMFSGGGKRIVEDTLIFGNSGTKGFAQVMIPFVTFYVACQREGLL